MLRLSDRPGVLPIGQNTPRRIKYDLVSESLNGTGFISSRATVKNVWLYRIYPTVAHEALEELAANPDLEANFSPSNPLVHTTPVRLTFKPYQLSPRAAVDFIDGIKSIAGSGEPTENEGLAIHVYACNKDMDRRAFSSIDGEMMILPCEGRLDVQTELGRMMVKPGELLVIPKGHRFSVRLPDGSSRGCKEDLALLCNGLMQLNRYSGSLRGKLRASRARRSRHERPGLAERLRDARREL